MKRRTFTQALLALGASSAFAKAKTISDAASKQMLANKIPSTGELIPVIGLGTNKNLNIDLSSKELPERLQLVKTFFDLGGEMLDSSPMYGSSEEVIGYCLEQLGYPKKLFSATKVWTRGKQAGIEQMQESLRLWRLKSFDLMQIHNLVDWKLHLKTLRQWKQVGLINYLGITTYAGREHQALIEIMKTEPLDFVQITYNIRDRKVEKYLLPLALDKGIAIIVNRPFKELFGYTKGKQLPSYATELGCNTWAQFYLKFAISHPAVTCAIPATSKIKHLKDNMAAGTGLLPDDKLRQEMINTCERYL
ncbi:aldo/keto reductase [Kangiella sp. TOML190]|uniref:aldo/keto reductase n=1 Tax=Kangiella sp. TOML190 TaxID=2931351 RepID=UPI00203FA6F7|nr:aldo/keto reductase [Kangiella sp. TOML190]